MRHTKQNLFEHGSHRLGNVGQEVPVVRSSGRVSLFPCCLFLLREYLVAIYVEFRIPGRGAVRLDIETKIPL